MLLVDMLMSNGIQQSISVPLVTESEVIFTEWNGTKWKITCVYFIPQPNMTAYKCLTLDDSADKIHCGKHKHKTRPYTVRSAYKCWVCALRHGYALRLSDTKPLE